MYFFWRPLNFSSSVLKPSELPSCTNTNSVPHMKHKVRGTFSKPYQTVSWILIRWWNVCPCWITVSWLSFHSFDWFVRLIVCWIVPLILKLLLHTAANQNCLKIMIIAFEVLVNWLLIHINFYDLIYTFLNACAPAIHILEINTKSPPHEIVMFSSEIRLLLGKFLSHFILGGLKYCVLTFKLIIWYNALIVYMFLHCTYISKMICM